MSNEKKLINDFTSNWLKIKKSLKLKQLKQKKNTNIINTDNLINSKSYPNLNTYAIILTFLLILLITILYCLIYIGGLNLSNIEFTSITNTKNLNLGATIITKIITISDLNSTEFDKDDLKFDLIKELVNNKLL